ASWAGYTPASMRKARESHGCRLQLIDQLTRDVRLKNFRVAHFLCAAEREISVDHDEISQFARFQRPKSSLMAHCISCSARIKSNRLLPGQLLARHEDASKRVTRFSCVEAEEWVIYIVDSGGR